MSIASLLLVPILAQAAPAPAQPPAAAPTEPTPKPLDVAEPPFAGDFAWMNGSNPQPPSLLTAGPITWSLYIDAYYAWQFRRPDDHTIFPTTVGPRHNEISLNLAHLGVDVTGLDGPIGRLYIQYGSIVETIAGQDTTTNRGFFLTNRLLQNVQQAAVGWHFHWLHGVNTEVGIFPSYVGLESYLPEENWAYTHAFISDATPYYFFGFRGQVYPSARSKLELWIVNGWQTFGQWHETKSGGYLWNWRPRDWLSIVNSGYAGREVAGDPDSVRAYSDNNVQIRYFKCDRIPWLRSLAISLSADAGYESRGNAPSGWIAGAALAHRFEWTDKLKSTLRADFLYDETQAISPKFPIGSAYPWTQTGKFLAGGGTVTMDYWPSPWLLTRLEYSHRIAKDPLFAGPGGITGPNGQLPSSGASAVPFTPDLRRSDDRILINVTLRL
jgi:hypothetical protein